MMKGRSATDNLSSAVHASSASPSTDFREPTAGVARQARDARLSQGIPTSPARRYLMPIRCALVAVGLSLVASPVCAQTGESAPASAATTAPAASGAGPRVRIATGLVEGAIAPSGVRLFRGIPFAAPPVGALRWKAPRPVTPWKGV